MTAWRGHIFLDAGVILYVGPGASAEQHAHHAVQLVWSCDGPFTLTSDAGSVQRTAVIVPASTNHALDSTGRTVALLLVEAHGERGQALDRLARTSALGELAVPAALFPAQVRDATAWCDELLAALGVPLARVAISPPTRKAIDYIERGLDGVPRVGEIAAQLGLSESRITHLFSREVGIPFRRFVLWTRLKHAVTHYRARADLTSAAIAAGFSDGAHFSRTFREMFGLSPSLLLATAQLGGPAWTPPG